MSSLELQIESAKALAVVHAEKCAVLIGEESLSAAISYCRLQKIEPPQCSLTAQTDNAEKLRNKAISSLTDLKWWSRRLEKQAIQSFEQLQRSQGRMVNFVSDEVLAYVNDKKSDKLIDR